MLEYRDPGLPLTPFERWTIRATERVNETAAGNRLQWAFTRHVGYRWTRFLIERHTLVTGAADIAAAVGDRSVMIVANHRSYFDFFAAMDIMLAHSAIWRHKLCFPVRAPFFYDNPVGVAINFRVAGGAMYPPIFRDERRSALNRIAVERVVNLLDKQSSVAVGFHPEGGRNKGSDPYAMLPSKPGAGEVALRSDVVVLPMFMNGLDNRIGAIARARVSNRVRREAPCICMFGPPIDCSDLREQGASPETFKAASERFRAAILALMPGEQALRKACAAGEVADDDHRWLINVRPGRTVRA